MAADEIDDTSDDGDEIAAQIEAALAPKALSTADVAVCSACAALLPQGQVALQMHAAWHARLVSVLKMADHIGTSAVLREGPL